ncbi:hypothetical protein [Reyranella sp.]|jgi:hypothetical protein|uniref:hypothetical protein n=1 Tax=Reyranella sp. TaxID=1929291 RepID=UPI000BCC5AA5|nr:hypothetical protein [Reyranella sp.]OYY34847.1 MAG: hypothetical protein B7Y57_26885 [Rhodospirillales bacterium 35-66-84]OYZ91271.1 MAG: hypothetical protein B7Y08_26090 [Rhodospirillales bacterium 24-66-33]OZB21330.1 MAG: hypothetical protein B7X63_27130 [Rhodospirillales bacterium 39-66-50]HQS18123.1 hypothetical protein [Reyranella sp.]HQT14811.1 hypothetical protein [Reyranella sp.]
MNSLLSTLLGWVGLAPPKIFCRRKVWDAGTRELARRTLGERRESGAYLLGRKAWTGAYEILDFVFYDDVDPEALATGIVTIRETALPRLWEICRARGYGVVADVHVHPGGYGQSTSDQANPVMPRSGHIAFILPNFARGRPRPGAIGMYEFLGAGRWADHSKRGTAFFRVRWRP